MVECSKNAFAFVFTCHWGHVLGHLNLTEQTGFQLTTNERVESSIGNAAFKY